MADTKRRIGLSLGADLCWPSFYEDIVAGLNPVVKTGGDTISFEVSRITIEPYDLRQPAKYDVVLDRLTHWYHTSREWIKKAIVMDDMYVLNNPFSLQAMEKHTSYAAMMRLGMPVPDTWMLPPKHYEPTTDLQITLESYARHFDLGRIGGRIGYPMFLKPFDGGAWVGVARIGDEDELRRAYEESGTRLMHLQGAVEPFDLFVRALAVGPQVNLIRYDPGAALHDRYKVDFDFVDAAEAAELADTVLTINTFFGWDFNSCEALRRDGVFHPIDYANACPDSQVTSLHYHIPWLVKAKIRWSLFCAATKRKMRANLDWEPYFEIAAEDVPYRDKLTAYAAIARERLDTDRFEDFCATHLADLDEAALEYFASDRARQIIRRKVEAVFPAHEVDSFTDHFWGLIEFWRLTETDRLSAVKAHESWYSDRVGRQLNVVRWGAMGTPVLLFPTAGGDLEEVERFGLIGALEPLLTAGRIKVYSVDSLAGQSWTRGDDPRHSMWLQNQYSLAIYHEVAPAIRDDCETPNIEIITAGASIGAFNAVAALCRFPDVFRLAIGMSGTYDLADRLGGHWSDDFYYSSPLHFLPGVHDPELAVLRSRTVVLASGQGRWEDPGETWKMAHALGTKGIPNRVDLWSEAYDHDWPTWREMLPLYLDDLA